MTKIQRLERTTKRGKYIIIVLACIFTIMLGYTITNIGNNLVEKVVVIGIGMICIIFINLVFCFIYKYIKQQNEYWIENEYLKESIPQEYSLTVDNFVEICLKYEENEDLYRRKIREKLEGKYYAKLISKDEIEVILQDKDGDLMEDPQRITDFHRFKNRFKLL